MTEEAQDMLRTLEHIETLALLGSLPGCLTAMTARLLSFEITNSDTALDALERAAVFVASVREQTR